MRQKHDKFMPGDLVTVIPEKGGSFIRELEGRILTVKKKSPTEPTEGFFYYRFEGYPPYGIREDCLRLVKEEKIPEEITNDSFFNMVFGGV